jgi:phage virion morphogenesis protein
MSKGFEVQIQDGASPTLLKIVQTMAKPRRLFEQIGADLEAEVALGFNDGADPYGNAWAHPVFRDGQPLRDTGRLMNSITHNADDKGVEIGTNVCYAATHQFGATITAGKASQGSACQPAQGAPFLVFPGPGGHPIFAKQVKIPARPFLPTRERGLPAEWWQQIRDRISAEMGVQ